MADAERFHNDLAVYSQAAEDHTRALGFKTIAAPPQNTFECKPRVIDMNATEITKMSVAERIEAMEAIWDSLMVANAKIESPDWHQDVLAERRRRLHDPSAEFVSLADLKIGP